MIHNYDLTKRWCLFEKKKKNNHNYMQNVPFKQNDNIIYPSFLFLPVFIDILLKKTTTEMDISCTAKCISVISKNW